MSIFNNHKDPLAAAAITPELRNARIADSLAFAIQAMLMVALLTSIPSLLPILGASSKQVALLVLGLSGVSAFGSLVITWVAEKTYSAFAIRLALGMLIVSSFALTFGPAAPQNVRLGVFAACTMIYGFSVGAVDATTNMQAVAIQRRYGRIILSSFHACWSAGAIVGSLVVSLGQWVGEKAGYGAPVGGGEDPYLYARYMWTMVVLIVLLGIVIALISPKMLKYGNDNKQKAAMKAAQKEAAKKFNPPKKIFAALCVAMVFSYTIDFGIQNWSSVFLTDIEHAAAKIAPLGVAAYTVLGMIARIVGDRLAQKFGESRTLLGAGVIALIGLVIVVTAHTALVAVIGFAIVGCGVPIVAPLCFSTIGYLVPFDQVDEGVGRLNLFNYLGTITGGGVTGLLSGGNMIIVIYVFIAMAIGLIVLSPFFRRPTDLEAVEQGEDVEIDVKLSDIGK